GLIQKSGAWFSTNGERIGQGRDNARIFLEQHPDLMGSLEKQILQNNGIGLEAGPADKRSGTEKTAEKRIAAEERSPQERRPTAQSEDDKVGASGKGAKANGAVKRTARPN